jgi:hypothetical protein
MQVELPSSGIFKPYKSVVYYPSIIKTKAAGSIRLSSLCFAIDFGSVVESIRCQIGNRYHGTAANC